MLAEAVVLILEEARKYRERAMRARDVARLIGPHEVEDNIVRYAAELEQKAVVLEARAAALEQAIGRNRDLSAEVQGLIEDTRRQLLDMRASLRSAHHRFRIEGGVCQHERSPC